MEVLYNGRHVTGSPFHQEIFDHRKVKLESAKPSGFIGDEMSLNGMYVYFLPFCRAMLCIARPVPSCSVPLSVRHVGITCFGPPTV